MPEISTDARCPVCGEVLEKKTTWQKFCTTKCRDKFWYLAHEEGKKVAMEKLVRVND